MDQQVLREWVDARCKEAMDASAKGDLGLLNALGKNPTFAYYVDNVYNLKAMGRDTFYSHPQLVNEMQRLYEAEQAEIRREVELREAVEAQNALKATVEAQAAQIEKLMAYFEEQAAKIAKAPKAGKDKPAPADDEPTEDA